MKASLLFLCCLLSARSLNAQSGSFFKTSDMLSASCRIAIRTWSEQNPSTIDLSIAQGCSAYLQGALDTLEFDRVQSAQKNAPGTVCVPTDVKIEQAIRVFMKYSDDHPEELHYGAPLVVWEAMHQAFPCP